MEEDMKEFIKNHGFAGRSDYYSYHIALGFYYAYSKEAYVLSEMVQDGEIFDDLEACAVVRNLEIAKRTYEHFRNKLFPDLAVFDTSETIMFQGCKLEYGKLTGQSEEAVKIAKKWLNQFYKKNSSYEKIEKLLDTNRKTVSGIVFLYEVAIYILYLCNETVDYRFLEKGNMSERMQEDND